MSKKAYSYFKFKNAKLHYAKVGSGSEVLFCFHGYGQSNESFSELEEVLGRQYTIYSFDLFYHGKSFWHDGDTPMSKVFWKGLLEEFLKEKQIDKFSVLGYSLGGKFALACLELFPDKVEKIFLLAPDGIKINFWYSLATYPFWGRAIFRKVVLYPQIYYSIAKILTILRLIDKRVLRFANSQMKTQEQRSRVYYSWVVFRKLKFDIKKLAMICNRGKIPVVFFLGEFDKIITKKSIEAFLQKLDVSELYILPTGHTHLIGSVAAYYNNNNPMRSK